MFALFLLLLGLTVVPADLGATTAVKLELDALTDHATVVARGKIKSKEARWNADRTGIWTHHIVDVSDTARGGARTSLEFVTRGGVVGKVGQAVSGSGTFEAGEEHVLFLAEDDEKRLALVGMVQGAFKLRAEGGQTLARNAYTGLRLVNATTLRALGNEGSAPLEFEVSDLLKRVRERVKAKAEADATRTPDAGPRTPDKSVPGKQEKAVVPEKSK